MSDLDAKGKVLSGRFCAMKLDRLPKYAPEETNVMSMMDRMRVVELQLNEEQDLSMRNRENIVKNARNIYEVANTPVTPEARCHYGFWSKPPSPQ